MKQVLVLETIFSAVRFLKGNVNKPRYTFPGASMKTALAIFDPVSHVSPPQVWPQTEPGKAGLCSGWCCSQSVKGIPSCTWESHTFMESSHSPESPTPSVMSGTIFGLMKLSFIRILIIPFCHVGFPFSFSFLVTKARLLCKLMAVNGVMLEQVQKLDSTEWTRRVHR